MYLKQSKITVAEEPYLYLLCDTIGLLKFMNQNGRYKKSLIDVMTTHRGNPRNPNWRFELTSFVLEAYNQEKKKKEVMYSMILGQDEVASLARIGYGKHEGYIDAVHTNVNFRGKKLCQKNLNRLLDIMYQRFEIDTVTLNVVIDNAPAIKCYKNCGFKIMRKFKQTDGVDNYRMKVKL